MDETVDAGLFVEGRYYLDLLIIHDYDALRAVLLYHLLIIGCWSVIAGFLYRSLLTDHGRRMTVSLFVLFWVRGRSRDLVAAGEEGWKREQLAFGGDTASYSIQPCCAVTATVFAYSTVPIPYSTSAPATAASPAVYTRCNTQQTLLFAILFRHTSSGRVKHSPLSLLPARQPSFYSRPLFLHFFFTFASIRHSLSSIPFHLLLPPPPISTRPLSHQPELGRAPSRALGVGYPFACNNSHETAFHDISYQLLIGLHSSSLPFFNTGMCI